MTEYKNWYESRGIWGGVVCFIAGIAHIVGYDIDQPSLLDALVAIGTTVGGIIAVIGRALADKQIG